MDLLARLPMHAIEQWLNQTKLLSVLAGWLSLIRRWAETKTSARPGMLGLIWPLGFAVGVGGYFSLTNEPGRDMMWCVWAMFFLCLGSLILVRNRSSLLMITLMMLAALGGFGRAQHRTVSLAETNLQISSQAVDVRGWLESIERGARGRARLVIRVQSLEMTDDPPHRIRVLANPSDFLPGDFVAVRAVLSRPSRPVSPGSYDFEFHAFFRELGATGYAITPIQIGQPESVDSFARALSRLRWQLADRIRTQLPGQTGAVAAALLAGDRSGIDPETADNLRVAGLGHLLAISGMHMALIAGGVFYVIRFVGTLFQPWARRNDAARPAAVGAMIAALLYLLISGGSIPTQRAFIMTISVLGAVLLSRRALSMHTLAVAMSLVLFFQPEALMGPGFQMSFAAVAALIAAYEAWRFRPRRKGRLERPNPVTAFLGGLSMTSIVAGLATSAFAIFHFHRMASYGLIGNLLAMPVFSLLAMPAGAMGLASMPFGLEALPLQIMGWGLELVFSVSAWTAELPGAMRPMPSTEGWVLALYSVGFVFVIVMRGAPRLIGLGLCLLAVLAWGRGTPPDMFISEDGVVVSQTLDGSTGWQVSTSRRARFDTRVFLEQHGLGALAQPMALACDDIGCSGRASGLRLGILESWEQWQEDCGRNRILVSRVAMPEYVSNACEALVLDARALARRGGTLIWTRDGDIVRIRDVAGLGGTRLWQHPSEDRYR
jgi:competence protein ComEC